MTNKEKYRRLCETEGARIPLFQQYWWMETVCAGKQWDVLLAERNGRIEGAMPYLIGKKYGLRFIVQPELTQFSGPWYNTDKKDLEFEMRVGDELAKQLSALGVNIYLQRFSPTITNWLPFYWHGYQQTTRYTYRFPSIADTDALFKKASRIRKRYMEDVMAVCEVDTKLTPEEFATFHENYYRRRGERDMTPAPLILRLCKTALEREQALLWGLRDKKHGSLQAAWFTPFDEHCAYSILLAIGPEAPNGAMTSLMWLAIKELSTHTQAFDFEGSMDHGTELFYRTFGTEQTPYFEVSKYKPAILGQILRLS